MAAPTPLYETINTAIALYLQLKKSGDKNKAADLRDTAGQLVTAFQTLQNQAQNLRADGAQHDAAVALIDSVVTVDDSVELKTFFEQVGSAIVDAQRTLDAGSLAYNQELDKASSIVPRALFAIPSVKAEMKLGFSQISTRGVNVVVFQNSEQKQKYGESTITFEIAASPLPPNSATLPAPAAPPADRQAPLQALGETELDAILAPVSGERKFGVPLSGAFSFDVPAALPPLDFPLRGDARTSAVAALKAAIGQGASELLARDKNLAVLPSSIDALARQDYLYMLPGSRSPGQGAAMRSFRIWRGAFESGTLEMTPNAFSAPGSIVDGALVIPANREGLREIADLAGTIRNAGDVLREVVTRARLFEPPFLVTAANERKIYDGLTARFADLLADEDFVILRDRSKGEEGQILLRPVTQSGTREWSEFHAVWMSRRRTADSVPSRVLIPETAVLEKWAATSKENLVLLASELKILFERLAATFTYAAG